VLLNRVVVCVVTASDIENWSVPSVDTDKHYVSTVRQADIDNHNSEGGLWVVVDGYVYDISYLRAFYLPQQIEQCIRKYAYFLYVGDFIFCLHLVLFCEMC